MQFYWQDGQFLMAYNFFSVSYDINIERYLNLLSSYLYKYGVGMGNLCWSPWLIEKF